VPNGDIRWVVFRLGFKNTGTHYIEIKTDSYS
jgi:hypothetical protein